MTAESARHISLARGRVWVALISVTVAGLILRAIPVAVTDFPVNDGGLFLAMIRAIQDAGWSLPHTVSWNGDDLPFIYPPLAFYAAGLGESALGVELFAYFRWFPVMASALIVPAVYLLGRELLRSELGGLTAALTYALAPSSYVWLIQGGGVARSPGLLLAVVTLWQVVILVRTPGGRRAVATGALVGLTALVHPGAAVLSAMSAVLIWAFEGRTRQSLSHALAALAIAVVVAAPWLVTVITRYGLAALTDVPSNGPTPTAAIQVVFAGRSTGLPFMDPLAVVGLATAIVCLVRRRYLLPLWFALATMVSFQYGMVPFSLLIGIATMAVASRLPSTGDSVPSGLRRWVPKVGAVLLAGCLVVVGVASSVVFADPLLPVHALSAERRTAMAWVDSETEPGASVAVVTNAWWSDDPDSEWFFLIAERPSVATVQGVEWLGRDAYIERLRAHASLQACVSPASVRCVKDWLAERPADYLYLPKGRLDGPASRDDCCADLRAELVGDPAFTLVYDGSGATILRVKAAGSTTRGGSTIVAPGPARALA